MWMAEFNNFCVKKLKDLYIGARDEDFNLWIERNSLSDAITSKRFDDKTPLPAHDWDPLPFKDLIWG